MCESPEQSVAPFHEEPSNLWRKLTEGENAPCFVRHPDAGGQCGRAAVLEVYELAFCELHGAEAISGALEEAYYDAEYFFERFRVQHVPRLNPVVELELKEAAGRMNRNGWANVNDETLRRAYPDAPEGVRDRITAWELDEAPGYAPVANRLLDCRHTLNKLMRLAHEAGETWLGEVLEYEREDVVAQAAFALRGREVLRELKSCGARPGE